jgi:hypothetical protein
MTEHDTLAERGRALEDEYFRKRDRELIEKMRKAAMADQTRNELGQKTGLQDPALLKELQDLGFTPDTVVLLPIVPVLEMAWAEGGITPAERDLLIQLARRRNIAEGTPADLQLSAWMSSRPAPSVFAHAGRLTAAMLASASDQVTTGLTADDLVAYCEKIAAASGGLLGLRIGSVSAEEKALLARIATDLKTRQP